MSAAFFGVGTTRQSLPVIETMPAGFGGVNSPPFFHQAIQRPSLEILKSPALRDRAHPARPHIDRLHRDVLVEGDQAAGGPHDTAATGGRGKDGLPPAPVRRAYLEVAGIPDVSHDRDPVAGRARERPDRTLPARRAASKDACLERSFGAKRPCGGRSRRR